MNLRQTSGPVLEKPKDLAAILTNLEKNDVLFIDEIHRLSPVVEEILYPALEDYQIDIMIGEGPAARSIKLDLQPFTLVGATTRAGMLTNPLRDRFGIVARLEFYTPEELTRIVTRSAGLLNVPVDAAGALEIARRSRGTPRIANRLLRRVRDYAQVKGSGSVDAAIADLALKMLDVDPLGFDVMDRKLLEAVIHRFDGGPVGLDNVAAAIGEEAGTIEDVIEPFLIQQGYPAAHAARPHRHAGGLAPPRPGAAGAAGGAACGRSLRRLKSPRVGLRQPARLGASRLRRPGADLSAPAVSGVGAGRHFGGLQVRGVVPAHHRAALVGVEQPVDAGVAQLPGARRVERDAQGGAVQAVEHAAVGDDRDGLPRVARRQPRHGGHAAGIERRQRLAAAGREAGLAPPPARGVVGPALLDLGEGGAFETTEGAFAQQRVGVCTDRPVAAPSASAVACARCRSLL